MANAAAVASYPTYVPARPVLEDVHLFDAAFFGVYPKEAELMDPQQRGFLECCWEAIEDAGYDPMNAPAMTGVYAGCSPSTYFCAMFAVTVASSRTMSADTKFPIIL